MLIMYNKYLAIRINIQLAGLAGKTQHVRPAKRILTQLVDQVLKNRIGNRPGNIRTIAPVFDQNYKCVRMLLII